MYHLSINQMLVRLGSYMNLFTCLERESERENAREFQLPMKCRKVQEHTGGVAAEGIGLAGSTVCLFV